MLLEWQHLTRNILKCLQTQVEVALAAADGDVNIAVEILMSQKVCLP